MAKGSAQRPRQIPEKEWQDNWETAFGKKDKEKE